MAFLKRLLRALPLLVLSPFLMAVERPGAGSHGPALEVVRPAIRARMTAAAPATAASVVIPNWNGKDLLAKYLPSVVAALWPAIPANEIVVVDNGSTDGSAEFVRAEFPAA